MSEQAPPPTGDPNREPTEEELRAAYEEQLRQIRVEDVLVETVVLAAQPRQRCAPGSSRATRTSADLDQVRVAIEAARALLPLVEPELGPQAPAVRDALSQLQMAYAQLAGRGAPGPGRGRRGRSGRAPRPRRRPATEARSRRRPAPRRGQARRAGAGAALRAPLGPGQ